MILIIKIVFILIHRTIRNGKTDYLKKPFNFFNCFIERKEGGFCWFIEFMKVKK